MPEPSEIVIQDESHPEYELIKQIELAILRSVGGEKSFREGIPELIRQAIDEVIDAGRSKRFTLDELEKTEKTYLGTKVEILLRNFLGFEKGRVLDLSIDGVEVDIKHTIGSSWMIPPEAMNHPCILVKEDERKALYSFGIVIVREDILRGAANRDSKGGISSAGMSLVHWMLKDTAYPENFWQNLSPEIGAAILAPRGGTQRLVILFQRVQDRPISRRVIESIAQQEDPMKRLRKNGGARDQLDEEGIVILWGGRDKKLIGQLGLPACTRSEFIAFKPVDSAHLQLLRKARRIK